MPGEREFFILSLKWTRGDLVCWWGPNNSGYCNSLASAGRYPESLVRKKSSYYNDGVSTLAVPVLSALLEACPVVPSGSAVIEKLRASALPCARAV